MTRAGPSSTSTARRPTRISIRPRSSTPIFDRSSTPAACRRSAVGSSAVREFIDELQPVIGLHGHVHESPGATKLGRTVCLNPGSDYQDGVLRGAIVELDTEEGLRSWQLVQG